MRRLRRNWSDQYGFTIVELLIVIVVVAILAAISIVAYNGIQERARFSSMRSDLASLNKAIQLYHADNGVYPVTPVGGSTSGPGCQANQWCGWDQSTGEDFIPGIVPDYISSTPQLPTTNTGSDTYLYRSEDGIDYKLVRLIQGGLSTSESAAMADMMTTDCSATII